MHSFQAMCEKGSFELNQMTYLFVCLFHRSSLFQKGFGITRREIHTVQKDIKLDVENKIQEENKGTKIKICSI